MIKKTLKKIYYLFLKLFFPHIYKTRNTTARLTFKTFFFQKILGINRAAYWPMHFTSRVGGVKNIKIGIGTSPGLSHGCYIQGIGKIEIGDYTIIAPNVGIISANHDLYDYRKHAAGYVKIGKYCWIGMNAIVLPNVELGDHTIVAAGSVVTKSFTDGYCVIGGNPAKIIKEIDPEKVVEYENEYKYYGYIPAEKFKKFEMRNLNG